MFGAEPIPPHLKELITTVYNNHDSMGGEQRGALAEIRVHSILATDRAATAYEAAGKGLEKVTRNLALATWTLAIATLALGVITACVK
ncbi:MAG: hypothetical protein NTX12_08890 [Actinobacteria bacterium]|nr:hypothetical protein [Actinomycetota bacterium]